MTTMAALAQPPRNGYRPEDAKGSRLDKVAEKLELTESQKAQFEQAMIAHHKAVKPLRNQLDEKRAALKTLSTANKVDQGKVDKTIVEIGDLQTAMLKAKVNHQIAVRSMLNDKQKMLFDQAHEHGGHGKGDKKGGPRRG